MRASLASSVLCVVAALSSGCVFEAQCVGVGATRDSAGRCVAAVDGGARDGAVRDGALDAAPLDAGPPDGGVDADLPDADLPDAGCSEVRRVYAAAADTMIHSGACNTANHLGESAFLNVGMGNGLFRFAVDAEFASALATGRVASARLVLYRAWGCGADACPATAGTLSARAMRSDWDEGIGGGSTMQVDYSGCDWCRRRDGTPPLMWAVNGATGIGLDVGPTAGTASFGVSETEIAVDLDPSVLGSWVGPSLTTTALFSLQVVPETGTFVAASHEAGAAYAATLELGVCP